MKIRSCLDKEFTYTYWNYHSSH